jgi:hypothetical protein
MILFAVLLYVLIGIGFLVWSIMTDPWGGIVLESPIVVIMIILGYPYFIVSSFFR